jgi:hypothetical protein
MGYPGHLWSHGIDYGLRQSVLDKILMGSEGWLEAAKQMGVTHIYWGEKEQEKYKGSSRAWERELQNLSSESSVGLYEIH